MALEPHLVTTQCQACARLGGGWSAHKNLILDRGCIEKCDDGGQGQVTQSELNLCRIMGGKRNLVFSVMIHIVTAENKLALIEGWFS